MLHENSIFDSKNIRRDPIDGLTNAGESAVHDDEISVSHNYARLISECWREIFDEVKQSLATRLDVSRCAECSAKTNIAGLRRNPAC